VRRNQSSNGRCNRAPGYSLRVPICSDSGISKYMLLSRQQNAGQNHDIKIANRCLKNVEQFRYLGTTVTNQNLMQEEIKRTLNWGNACNHSVQNLLSSRLLSKT
jgi:hypothetical protein